MWRFSVYLIVSQWGLYYSVAKADREFFFLHFFDFNCLGIFLRARPEAHGPDTLFVLIRETSARAGSVSADTLFVLIRETSNGADSFSAVPD